MKIRDLNLDDYVIVYDIGRSENSEGMMVVGRVEEIVFNDDRENVASINSLGNLYEITDNNYFDLWSKSIEGKTESINTTVKWNDNGNLEVKDNYEVKVPDDILNNNSNLIGYVKDEIKTHRSNDVQQRKRNKKIVQWSDDTKLKFIERAIQDLSPLAAYHIGNAIDVLAVAESKEDIEQARWSIQRAYENWDVK